MSELLSSDALEKQFGPTELEVLQQDDGGRIICTKAAEDGKILELSQVVFHPEGIEAFPEIHDKIIQGTSIGKAFVEAGVLPKRKVRASYRYDQRTLPANFAERFNNSEPPTVIDLSFVIEPDEVPYASILEVFSPSVDYWENLTGGEMGQEIADRLEVFGAELAMLDDAA